MARWLKQSTSVDVPIGPFVDSIDGVTAETGLTLTQPDIRLKKNGGAWAQKNAAQTLSHEENGNYEVTLDATDTDTLGLLRLHVAESDALPVWEDFMVVPANVWDSLFGADVLDVSVTQWLGTAAATPSVAGVPEVDVTHVAGSATTATLDTIKSDTAAILVDTSTTLQAELDGIQADTEDIQTRLPAVLVSGRIDASVGAMAANTLTASALAADAVTEIQSGLSTLDAAGVRSAVGLASANLDTQLDALPTANENADALLDRSNGVETGWTLRQVLRLMAAVLFGKASGMSSTTAVFRDLGDTKDRITATVDSAGNRSAITRDAT